MATDSASQSRPTWLQGVAQPAPLPNVVSQPIIQATQPMKDYATWYAWARAHEADTRRCHLAAQAAVAALAQGQDSNAAGQAAQAAAYAAAPDAQPAADARTRSYASWYTAGLQQIKLDAERAHRFAYAALLAQESGADSRAAARAGLDSLGMRPPASSSWLSDPAIRSVILGGVSVFALLFLPFYFVVLPVLGLLYAIRTLATPRMPVAALGLFLNGAAIVITLGGFLGLRIL